jgi:hypothetical protein
VYFNFSIIKNSFFKDTNANCVNRAVPIATQILSGQDKGIRVLQASWHPFSGAHFCLLTSDAVFRCSSKYFKSTGEMVAIPF